MIAFVERVEAKQFFNKKQPAKKDTRANQENLLKIESGKKQKLKEIEKIREQKLLTEEQLSKGIFQILSRPPRIIPKYHLFSIYIHFFNQSHPFLHQHILTRQKLGTSKLKLKPNLTYYTSRKTKPPTSEHKTIHHKTQTTKTLSPETTLTATPV